MSHSEASKALHPPALQSHFRDMEQQRESATLGMFVFLLTEVMMFGGLFCGYLVYRSLYYPTFELGSIRMHLEIGAINTAVLICSSLTMALAVHSAQRGRQRSLQLFLVLTLMLGLAFLALKGVEYHRHWVDHEVPGFHFAPSYPMTAGTDPGKLQLFFALYFLMTGLHALHMLIGAGLVTGLLIYAVRGHFSEYYHNPVENVGLYWHFVDIVWIYLFPLLYLISRFHH